MRAFLLRTRVNGLRVPVKVFMGRVVVAFDAKPHPLTCNCLRKWGFEWSPALGAWVHPCGSAYALARERARVRDERAVLVDRAADYEAGVEVARKVPRLVHDGTELEAAARAALNELSAATDLRVSPA